MRINDFIKNNRLTMEEKQRLNELYGKVATHCYADTDSFKVDLENVNIVSKDKARCEYKNVLKTGCYPIEDSFNKWKESRLTDEEEN